MDDWLSSRRSTKTTREEALYKHRNPRWASVVAATVALSWLLPGGALAQDKPLTPVRAAYIPVATWLPAWVALDKGIFAKHGLAVSLTQLRGFRNKYSCASTACEPSDVLGTTRSCYFGRGRDLLEDGWQRDAEGAA
jgi:hypothetical protein